jgi:hypothetical protein
MKVVIDDHGLTEKGFIRLLDEVLSNQLRVDYVIVDVVPSQLSLPVASDCVLVIECEDCSFVELVSKWMYRWVSVNIEGYRENNWGNEML